MLLLAYLVGLCAVWSALYWAGDRLWPATVLLFIPRCWWGLPLPALIGVVVFRHRRLLGLIGLASVICIGPVMRLCLSWPICFQPQVAGRSIRVLTCNADSLDLDPSRFAALLHELQPSIVCMQDVCPAHVRQIFGAKEWHVHVENGLCLASRFPIRAVERIESAALGPGLGWAMCYTLQTPEGDVRCINLHLATPRWGLLALLRGESGPAKLRSNSTLRRNQSTAISRQASRLAGPLVVLGDFNTPVESNVYRECWSAFQNAFSEAGLGWGSTYLIRYIGVRIDHILVSRDFDARRCWVGPDVGSEHRPLIADLARIHEASGFARTAREPHLRDERTER